MLADSVVFRINEQKNGMGKPKHTNHPILVVRGPSIILTPGKINATDCSNLGLSRSVVPNLNSDADDGVAPGTLVVELCGRGRPVVIRHVVQGLEFLQRRDHLFRQPNHMRLPILFP